jgi:hypothetical protein
MCERLGIPILIHVGVLGAGGGIALTTLNGEQADLAAQRSRCTQWPLFCETTARSR